MKKQHKKTGVIKEKSDKKIPKVKRSDKATGVNENHTSAIPGSEKSIFPKRSPFADEIGTAIPDPNK